MSGEEPSPLSISQLAHRLGVNVETIRYYERIGLIRQPRKPSRAWRRYDAETMRRIRFIRRTQALGFTLAEVKELLALKSSTSQRTCQRVSKKATDKIDQIDAKLRDLEAMKRALSGLVASCGKPGSGTLCPILDALERG